MKTSAIIAEDESILRLFLSMTLGSMGIEIKSEAQNGREAIDAVREYIPDVVFLDINMETKEDGLDACDAIKAEFPSVKIYFISAYPENVFRERLNGMHYDGYIEKPVNREYLQNFLQKNQLIRA